MKISDLIFYLGLFFIVMAVVIILLKFPHKKDKENTQGVFLDLEKKDNKLFGSSYKSVFEIEIDGKKKKIKIDELPKEAKKRDKGIEYAITYNVNNFENSFVKGGHYVEFQSFKALGTAILFIAISIALRLKGY